MTNVFRRVCTPGCQSGVELKQFSRPGLERLLGGGNTVPRLLGIAFSRGTNAETRLE